MELPRVHSGKVRELYDAGAGRLLMVASDRVSAFDVVMAEPITDKGRVLTAMTTFWCDEMADVVPGSQITADPVAIADALGDASLPPEWAGRAVLVQKADMLQLECIVRGYLAGQAYEEYERSGTVHGTAMPAGLQLASRLLDGPSFTLRPRPPRGTTSTSTSPPPSTFVGAEAALAAPGTSASSSTGGRRPCRAEAGLRAGRHQIRAGLRRRGALPVRRSVHARLLADCGRPTRSSPARRRPPSTSSPCADWLAAQTWDRRPPPPLLPDEVTSALSARYVAAYERVTGRSLDDWYGATP